MSVDIVPRECQAVVAPDRAGLLRGTLYLDRKGYKFGLGSLDIIAPGRL